MKKFPKPWYRPARGAWYVTLQNKQHHVGPDRDAAFRRYHELMANPPETPPRQSADAPTTYLIGLIQKFMADVRASRAPETVEWYRQRLQLLVDYLSDRDLDSLEVEQLKRGHINEWMNSYPHLSSGSKRNLCRAIQRVMNWALENDHIDQNPLVRMRKPKAGKRERVIADAEWQDVLALVDDDDFRDLLHVTWEWQWTPCPVLSCSRAPCVPADQSDQSGTDISAERLAVLGDG